MADMILNKSLLEMAANLAKTQPAPDKFAARVQFGAAELVERVAIRVYDGDREITSEVFGAEFGEVIP